jgi:hypothetical protein
VLAGEGAEDLFEKKQCSMYFSDLSTASASMLSFCELAISIKY